MERLQGILQHHHLQVNPDNISLKPSPEKRKKLTAARDLLDHHHHHNLTPYTISFTVTHAYISHPQQQSSFNVWLTHLTGSLTSNNSKRTSTGIPQTKDSKKPNIPGNRVCTSIPVSACLNVQKTSSPLYGVDKPFISPRAQLLNAAHDPPSKVLRCHAADADVSLMIGLIHAVNTQ